MIEYDPENAPSPKEWLAIDEQLRIMLAEDYHRRERIKVPNRKAHAIFHAIVENQIAGQLDCVVRAMPRLMAEGLSRHDAIHAISYVLVFHINSLFAAGETSRSESLAAYVAAVDRLTARAWLNEEL